MNHVINQVSKSCGSMYSIREHVPSKVLRQVYLSLVQPYITYCLPLWGQNSSSCVLRGDRPKWTLLRPAHLTSWGVKVADWAPIPP